MSRYICKITCGGFKNKPSRKPPPIPIEDWEYYLRECQPYPEYKFTVASGHPLPDECGYSFDEKGNRHGECNHCGVCCKTLVTTPHMIDPKTGVCKYLMEESE